MYLAGVVDIQYGALQDIEVAIAKQEAATGENFMLTDLWDLSRLQRL
jgi:hypothetical protein